MSDPYEQEYYIQGGMFGALPGGGTFGAAALSDFDRMNPSASRFQRISGISGFSVAPTLQKAEVAPVQEG